MTKPLLDLIRARLGPKPMEAPYHVAGRDGVAYRASARSKGVPCTLEEARAGNDPMSLELEEVAADTELRARGVAYFMGTGGTELYAIPDLPPIDVVEFARVGTHNRSEDGWREVRQLLLETAESVGFDVVFADEAGLDVRFPRPVAQHVALEWDRTLLDRIEAGALHWTDSYMFMLDRTAGLDPIPGADERGGGMVPAFILARQSLRFWWD